MQKSKLPFTLTLRMSITGCSFLLIPLEKQENKAKDAPNGLDFTQAELKEVPLLNPACTDEKETLKQRRKSLTHLEEEQKNILAEKR